MRTWSWEERGIRKKGRHRSRFSHNPPWFPPPPLPPPPPPPRTMLFSIPRENRLEARRGRKKENYLTGDWSGGRKWLIFLGGFGKNLCWGSFFLFFHTLYLSKKKISRNVEKNPKLDFPPVGKSCPSFLSLLPKRGGRENTRGQRTKRKKIWRNFYIFCANQSTLEKYGGGGSSKRALAKEKNPEGPLLERKEYLQWKGYQLGRFLQQQTRSIKSISSSNPRRNTGYP